ncbi:MAG: serine hydrolase domain-containing protein, partial [Stackebrandtia sp.]
MRTISFAAVIGLAAALSLAPAASAKPAGELDAAAIDEYLEQAVDDTGVPGLTAVVTHDDKIVHATGVGHDSNGEELTADSPMRMASVTKSFTAMAVMTLVEDGEIELDEPVSAQLPGFEMADPRADEVTVRQLLNQTSGFSDTTMDVADLEESTSLADYASRMKDDALAHDPGTRWEYCNANFDLAARLVEHAGGRNFNEYLKARVLRPLGMDDSTVSDADIKPGNGYNSLYGLWIERSEPAGFMTDSGAGGLTSTAADMGRWLITQQGEGKQLVGAEGLAEMHAASPVHDYGMGWGVDGKRLVHSGNLMSYNSVEILDTGTGYGVAVMTNGSGLIDPAYSVGQGLLSLSEGAKPAPVQSDFWFQLVLAVLALLALGLGVLGVLRA